MVAPLHWLLLGTACVIGLGLGVYGLAPEAAKPPVAHDTQADLPSWLRVLPNSPVAQAQAPTAPTSLDAPLSSAGLPAPAAQTPAVPAAQAAPNAAPAVGTLSVQVAPGVHITPLSVPAGTVPEPAGPRPGDSEPEEN